MLTTMTDLDQLNGTYLCGVVPTTYARLVDAFGEPNPEAGDDYKTDAEWALVDEEGRPVSIYNYKDGVNYNGPDGMPVEQITDWHVGGHGDYAVVAVKAALTERALHNAGS